MALPIRDLKGIEIGRQVRTCCEGVTAVETAGHLDSWGRRMVPGDIKPENALLDEKGYAKAGCQCCQLVLRCGEGQESTMSANTFTAVKSREE